MTSKTTTVSPATRIGDPPSTPTTRPPTIPAMRPETIGAPDASATPSESAIAMKNTTSEAVKSFACGFGSSIFGGRMFRTAARTALRRAMTGFGKGSLERGDFGGGVLSVMPKDSSPAPPRTKRTTTQGGEASLPGDPRDQSPFPRCRRRNEGMSMSISSSPIAPKAPLDAGFSPFSSE